MSRITVGDFSSCIFLCYLHCKGLAALLRYNLFHHHYISVFPPPHSYHETFIWRFGFQLNCLALYSIIVSTQQVYVKAIRRACITRQRSSSQLALNLLSCPPQTVPSLAWSWMSDLYRVPPDEMVRSG